MREDWVLVQQDGVRVVGLVRDMMECLVQDEEGVHSVVRFWCEACVEPRTGELGEMWAPPPRTESAMLVAFEDTQVTVKTRIVHAQHNVYA